MEGMSRMKMCELACDLHDFGWKSWERKALITDVGLTADEAKELSVLLSRIERRGKRCAVIEHAGVEAWYELYESGAVVEG